MLAVPTLMSEPLKTVQGTLRCGFLRAFPGRVVRTGSWHVQQPSYSTRREKKTRAVKVK